MLCQVVNHHHMPLPVIPTSESLSSFTRKLASWHEAAKLCLYLMAIGDMTLEMSLGAKRLAAARICAVMIFAMISHVMPVDWLVFVANEFETDKDSL